MGHKIQVIIQMLKDPWTYYFLFWFIVGSIIYITGDKWKRQKESRMTILNNIKAELHETAEMHNDGDYYLRDKWVDEIIDKYADQPCDDAVSRQAVDEMIKAEMPERGMWEIEGDKEKEIVCEVCVDLMQKLSDLPPVRPQEQTGHWIHIINDKWKCSRCENIILTEGSWEKPEDRYCKECGARMVEPKESEVRNEHP